MFLRTMLKRRLVYSIWPEITITMSILKPDLRQAGHWSPVSGSERCQIDSQNGLVSARTGQIQCDSGRLSRIGRLARRLHNVLMVTKKIISQLKISTKSRRMEV